MAKKKINKKLIVILFMVTLIAVISVLGYSVIAGRNLKSVRIRACEQLHNENNRPSSAVEGAPLSGTCDGYGVFHTINSTTPSQSNQ